MITIQNVQRHQAPLYGRRRLRPRSRRKEVVITIPIRKRQHCIQSAVGWSTLDFSLRRTVGVIDNTGHCWHHLLMKAVQLVRTRITYSESAFAELVLWQVSKPVAGSRHRFKYRLAYVVHGTCVLRYDHETGKADHRHFGGKESAYMFSSVDQLIADFQRDIARWNRENPDS